MSKLISKGDLAKMLIGVSLLVVFVAFGLVTEFTMWTALGVLSLGVLYFFTLRGLLAYVGLSPLGDAVMLGFVFLSFALAFSRNVMLRAFGFFSQNVIGTLIVVSVVVSVLIILLNKEGRWW